MQESAKRSRRSGILRRPGDRWMLRGPLEYVPLASVEVLLTQRAIPLDENEGIYVRDIKTGKVSREGRGLRHAAGQMMIKLKYSVLVAAFKVQASFQATFCERFSGI